MTLDELIAQTCDPADMYLGSIWARLAKPGVIVLKNKSSRTYEILVSEDRETARLLALELREHVEALQKLLGS